MKKSFLILTVIALVLATAYDSYGQKKPTKKKPKAATTTPKKPAPSIAVVDTAKPVSKPPAPVVEDTIPLRPVVPSRRPSTTIDSGAVTITDKIPLKHDNIRLDDQVYRQVIWRVIDTREKINMAFNYAADEDNGNQRFLNIILKHIKEGDITAFDAGNDRFTVPLTVSQVAKMLSPPSYVVQVPDWVNDPTGTLGYTKDSTIRDEFDENTVKSFAIKEEVIFDRETSRLHFRILGIAPMKTVYNSDGSVRATYRMFWVYYPELRPYLSRYDAYNPRNMGARMSWEEVFESRYFSSYIYKSTLNNPGDMQLEGIIKDPLMRLLEGERIKETIFNWEQDQWSY
jgi:gliding motility associated protien GldN